MIWAVVAATPRTGNAIPATWSSYPVKSDDVLTTFALILMGVGEEVDIKF